MSRRKRTTLSYKVSITTDERAALYCAAGMLVAEVRSDLLRLATVALYEQLKPKDHTTMLDDIAVLERYLRYRTRLRFRGAYLRRLRTARDLLSLYERAWDSRLSGL